MKVLLQKILSLSATIYAHNCFLALRLGLVFASGSGGRESSGDRAFLDGSYSPKKALRAFPAAILKEMH